MLERKTANGLAFEALRHAVERYDPKPLLDFYADDARLSIFIAEAQRSLPFELSGGQRSPSAYERSTGTENPTGSRGRSSVRIW